MATRYKILSERELKTDLTDNSDSFIASQKAVKTAVDSKQNTLVSGTNIKTINSESLLGSGDIVITGGGGNPYFIPSYYQSNFYYTDDLEYIARVSTNLEIYKNAINTFDIRYTAGVRQTISKTTIWADATNFGSSIVVGGYIYVQLYNANNSNETRVYRCPVSSDGTSSGNWTQLTISGTVAFNYKFIGYGNSKFWFGANSGGSLIPFTLSGTTLTEGTTINPSGAAASQQISRACGQGVYVSFGTAPYWRFSDFSGNLDSTKQFSNTTSSVYLFGVGDDIYYSSYTDSGYLSGFVKLT